MLRATRRVLRTGGRTAFFTIYVPNAVPAGRRRPALAAAPKFGWSRAEHEQLMRSAGFGEILEIDRTAEYHETLRAWHDLSAEHAEELAAMTSPALFEDRQRERRAALAAIEAGEQRRVLIVGTKPHRCARPS